MNLQLLLPVLAVSGSLLLVVTSLLNFSVFRRQLSFSRQQLETARWQLQQARLLPEIQLVQRAMAETSDHLKLLVERPYLRPYFYENKSWAPGDHASQDEVKAMAELLLDNLASAIIHSATFPQYPIAASSRTFGSICAMARLCESSSAKPLIASRSPASPCSR